MCHHTAGNQNLAAEQVGQALPVSSRKGSRSREVLIDQEADSDRAGEEADAVKHFGQGRGRGLSSLSTTRTRKRLKGRLFCPVPRPRRELIAFREFREAKWWLLSHGGMAAIPGRNSGDQLSLVLLLLCYVKQWFQAELSLADSIFPGQPLARLLANVQEDDPAPSVQVNITKPSTTHEAQAKLTTVRCKHMNAQA